MATTEARAPNNTTLATAKMLSDAEVESQLEAAQTS